MDRRSLLLDAALACAIGALFLLICFPTPLTSDDAATLGAVAAIADTGSLAVPRLAWLDERVDIGITGPDGNLYSKYGLGLVLASLPLYELGKLIPSPPFNWAGFAIADSSAGARATLLVNPILAALSAFVIAQMARRLWRVDGAFTAIVLSIATPLFFAARGYGSELGAALCLLLAAWFSLDRRYALGMACVCAAALFRPVTLCFAAAWLVLLWRRPATDWLKTAAVLAAGVALLAAYNALRYGSITQTGYTAPSGFALQIEGVIGFLFSPGRSLILFMPICLLLIPSAVHAWRARDRFLGAILAGIGAFILAHAAWRQWHADWAYGPRLLIPIVPLITLVVAPYLPRRLALPLILIGACAQLITLADNPIAVHDRAIVAGGIPMEETIWSLDRNILVLQARTLLDPAGVAVIGIMLLTCASLALLSAWVRGRPAGEIARESTPG